MITDIGKTLEIDCASCGKQGPHEVTCADDEPLYLLCCSTCGKVNAYTLARDTGAKPSARLRATAHEHASLMEQRGSRSISPYAITGAFNDGQYLEHRKFGAGYVLAVFQPPVKMEVSFSDGRRVLVCGPGSTNSRQRAEERAREAREQVARTRAQARKARSLRAASPGRSARPRSEGSALPSGDRSVKCPKCDHVVHPHNLSRTTDGTIVGCMYCR